MRKIQAIPLLVMLLTVQGCATQKNICKDMTQEECDQLQKELSESAQGKKAPMQAVFIPPLADPQAIILNEPPRIITFTAEATTK